MFKTFWMEYCAVYATSNAMLLLTFEAALDPTEPRRLADLPGWLQLLALCNCVTL